MMGSLHGYYPSEDPILAWAVDSIIVATDDLANQIWNAFMNIKGYTGEDPTKAYLEKHLPKYL
jgi:hypothetical protein